jgi:hypothetical protein
MDKKIETFLPGILIVFLSKYLTKMFNTFDNNTKIINHVLKTDCVTLKLLGLTTKLLINDLIMFMFGLVITIILADMLADYMLFNIEDAKKKKEETNALLKEITKLQEEIKDLNLKKGLKKVPSETIVQCDKCYNEFCETEIKTRKIIGQIYQQYCINCYYSQSMRKSQSDSKLNYQ